MKVILKKDIKLKIYPEFFESSISPSIFPNSLKKTFTDHFEIDNEYFQNLYFRKGAWQ